MKNKFVVVVMAIMVAMMMGSFVAYGAEASGKLVGDILILTSTNAETTIVRVPALSQSWNAVETNAFKSFVFVSPSFQTVQLPPLTNIQVGVWGATTTAIIVSFAYGTNTSFFVELAPDWSSSFRKVIGATGEFLGALVPTAGVVEYYFDPAKLTSTRFFAMFIQVAIPPPT